MLGQAGTAEPLARYATLRTVDVAEAEEVVSGLYVPHRLSAAGALDARLNVVRSGPITVGYLAYGAEARLAVPPMRDAFHVNLTLTGTTHVRQGGGTARTSAHRSGVMLSPTETSTLTWSADAAQFALKLERAAVERQLAALLGDRPARPLRFDLAVDLTRPAGAALLTAVRFLAAQLELQDAPQDLVLRHLESYILTQVLLGVPNNYSDRLGAGGGGARPSVLDDVADHIEAHPDRPLELAELAALAGVPAAAFRAAFRARFGCTPAEYVREVRLARAHAQLRGGLPPGTGLADVARRWGFTDVGRFTAAYSARYGAPQT